MSEVEEEILHVRTVGGAQAIWRAEYSLSEDECGDVDRCQLSVIDPLGERYEATGRDLYECLKDIRRITDQAGILLCCNGARKNAMPLGSLRRAGAYYVDTYRRWRAALPWDQVETFGYAPPRKIVSVAEQEAYMDAYLKPTSAWGLLNPVLWVTFGFSELYWSTFFGLRRLRWFVSGLKR